MANQFGNIFDATTPAGSPTKKKNQFGDVFAPAPKPKASVSVAAPAQSKVVPESFKQSLQQERQQSLRPEVIEQEYLNRMRSPFEPNPKAPLPPLTFFDKVQENKSDKFKLLPIVSGGAEAADFYNLLTAANRLKDGKESRNDIKLLQAYVAESKREQTFGFKVANTVSEIIPFAGEILLTAGLGAVVKQAALKGGKNVLKKLLTKEGAKILEKKVVKYGLQGGAQIVGATVQAPVAGMTRIPASTLQKQLDSTLNQFQTGKPKEDVSKSLKKAFGEQWVEVVSEYSGGLLTKANKLVGNNLMKVALFSAFKKSNPLKSPALLKTIVERAGWNGLIGEMFEERVADVGHGILNKAGLSDQKFQLPTGEQLAVEFVSFAVPGVGIGVANSLLEKVTPVGPGGMTIQEQPVEVIDFNSPTPVVQKPVKQPKTALPSPIQASPEGQNGATTKAGDRGAIKTYKTVEGAIERGTDLGLLPGILTEGLVPDAEGKVFMAETRNGINQAVDYEKLQSNPDGIRIILSEDVQGLASLDADRLVGTGDVVVRENVSPDLIKGIVVRPDLLDEAKQIVAASGRDIPIYTEEGVKKAPVEKSEVEIVDDKIETGVSKMLGNLAELDDKKLSSLRAKVRRHQDAATSEVLIKVLDKTEKRIQAEVDRRAGKTEAPKKENTVEPKKQAVKSEGKLTQLNKAGMEKEQIRLVKRMVQNGQSLDRVKSQVDGNTSNAQAVKKVFGTTEKLYEYLGVLPKTQRTPSGQASTLSEPIGQATAGAERVGDYETDEEAQAQGLQEYKNFKLFEKVQALIQKYAKTVGQGYTPRGALGVFYTETENVRVNGMNDLSVASHEITHFLDKAYKISEQIIGKGIKGAPVLRRQMTDLYEKFYPGGKRNHKLKKRMTEGFATLLQKYVQSPKAITAEFPGLVKEFLQPGGKYYQPVMGEIIKDLREIVSDYQGLSELDKVHSRIVDGTVNVNKKDWLTVNDKIFEEVADNVYPIEKLAKMLGVHFTKKDPSLWIRQYNNINQLITNNIQGRRGYWTWRDGEFVKLHDFNWRTLYDQLRDEKTTRDFNAFLIARNEHFLYKELAELRAKDETTKEEKARAASLDSILKNDGFTKEEVDGAYEKNLENFKEEAEMYDTLVREDLNFLHDSEIQLVNDEQYAQLTSREGYASMKREFYDEVVGEQEVPTSIRVGKTKVSSLIQRKGSQRPIISPLYSAIANHAEITKKGMRQIIYNRLGGIADKAPALFQKLELQAIPDRQGKILYPQEKDPNIIMTRRGYKRVPILVDATVKRVVDEVLTTQNISYLERLIVKANRLFVKGTTGVYPAFMLSNTIIDQISATSLTRNKFIPLYDPLRKVLKAVTISRKSPQHDFLIEYLVMGGERQTLIGWQDLSPNELSVKLRNEERGLQMVLDALNKGLDYTFAAPSKYSEIMTRAAEYIKSREAGKPTIVAIEEAGRVSIPFHHIGRLGGGRFGKTIIKSIPFFNPGLQVLAQTYTNAASPQGRQRLLFVFLAMTAAEVAAVSLVAKYGDDDQKEALKDKEGKLLADNIYLPNPKGKTLIAIRVPANLTWLGALINMAMQDSALAAKHQVGDYVATGTSFLPAQVNPTRPVEALLAWIPQLMKPAIMASLNKQDFPKIRPLESQSQEAKTPGLRYNEATSSLAKKIGKKANISPIKIDYLLTGYLGRATGFVTGKPGIWNILKRYNQDYYLESGRRVQNFYDLKKTNEQEYHDFKNGLLEYPQQKVDQIVETRAKVKSIDTLLDAYRTIDLEKSADEAANLRMEILKLINDL